MPCTKIELPRRGHPPAVTTATGTELLKFYAPENGNSNVLPKDPPVQPGAEDHRGLARQGRTACSLKEIRRRRANDEPAGARHEGVHLSGPERVRLCQRRRRLAFRTDAATARRYGEDGR